MPCKDDLQCIFSKKHKKEFSIGLNAMAQTSFFMLSLLTYGLMPQLSDPKISSTLILMLHKILELKARHNMYILLWVLHYFSGGRSRAQYSSFTSRCLIGTFHRMLMVQDDELWHMSRRVAEAIRGVSSVDSAPPLPSP